MITARENILMAYHHEEPYWVPSQYLDQNTCVYTASQEGAHGYGCRQIDCFGVSWDFQPGMEGQMVTPGTKRLNDVTEWEDLTFPDVEKWDWENAAARDTASWDRKNKISTVIMINGLFEQMHTFMGVEEAAVDLLLEPEATNDFLDKLTEYRIRQIQMIKKYYNPVKITFHDDYGEARNLMMSKETWQELMKPHLKKIVEAVHGEGMLYEHHSCGYIAPLIEEFIDLGFDALNPLQIKNDPFELKKKYRKDLCFVGGFDNQGILDRPGATYEERVKELRYRIELMAPGGSWIAHPVMIDPNIGLALADVLYDYNQPLWDKVGYVAPPKPSKVAANAYTKGHEK